MRLYRISTLYSFAFLLLQQTILAQVPLDKIKQEFLNSESSMVLVAAHRAAHDSFPENSIPAIQRAIDLGVDIIEIDVKVTRDGVPVLMHDGTVDRTTTGFGRLENMRFEEVKNLYLLQEDTGQPTKYRVPSLEEVFKITSGKVLIDLDLKTDNLDPIIEVIKKTGAQDHAFFFDSDFNILRQIEENDSTFMIMPRVRSFDMTSAAVQAFDPEVIHIDFGCYKPDVVDMIRKDGARVWINALGMHDIAIRAGKVDDAMDKLLAHGANIIQTDEPALLLQVLRRYGKHD